MSARRRLFVAALVILGLALLAMMAVAGWAWWSLQRPHKAFPGDEKIVRVEPGSGAGEILALLEREGVVADATLARAYLVYVLRDPSLQAGEYRFEGFSTTPEALDKLVRGDVVVHAVTVIEGLTLEEIAATLTDAGFGELDAFLAAMRSPGRIADLDPEAEDLEGYLFPDTYTFPRGTTEAGIVDAMVANFRRRFTEEVEPLLSGERSLREVVTLASVVEKEARIASERPVIAGVYANRLERGIALYADPTVIYALKRRGEWDGNLRRPDLRLDSPYNTYRYPGLPPGPICSPGLGSLEAAARPAEVPYLYFVSRNDGTHVFAETLAEHNRNVETWQKRYWRERWAREREEATGENPGR